MFFNLLFSNNMPWLYFHDSTCNSCSSLPSSRAPIGTWSTVRIYQSIICWLLRSLFPTFFFFIINFPTGGLPHLFHSVVFPYWVIPNHIQTCCYVSDVHGRGKQISNNNKKTCLDPTLFIPFPSFLSFSNNILWKNCINDSQSFLLLSFQPLPIKLLSLSLH